MLQSYLSIIKHNRYLKLPTLKNIYEYSKLTSIKITIKFTSTLNSKFSLLCIFFLFKHILFKNGYFIIVKKKTNKILGLKFILKHQLMYQYLQFLLVNFLIQPEVQNNIKIKSFDNNAKYLLILKSTYFYYFEKSLTNKYYIEILSQFQILKSFIFSKNTKVLDHILFLNFFKFYFS